MRVLLVEDDARLGRLIYEGLREEGHVVDLVDRGADAVAQVGLIGYDVVILDWMLPDTDGLAVLRRWRDNGQHLPVLMLTARGSVGERVAGLRAGADDYLIKPFAFAELLARVEALHRRSGGTATRLLVGEIALDHGQRALSCAEQRAELTGREYALAKALFERPGEVRTRSELLAEVWGESFDGEPNVVDVYVGYLRRKLEQLGGSARIDTVRGVGFRLRADGGAA